MNDRMALLAALTIALAGCNDKPAPSATPSAAAPPDVAATPTVELKEGDPAPNVDLVMQTGKTVKLASFAGKPVAIYFYPKDDTPGCRVEAQGMRDNWEDLQKEGIVVIGVSTQDAESHKAFIEKEKLPFDLAVDQNAALAKAFGVPLRNGLAARHTFLVDKEGKIKRVWRSVKPDGHAQEIVAAAK